MRRAVSLTVYVENEDTEEVAGVLRAMNTLVMSFLDAGYAIDTSVFEIEPPSEFPDAQVVEFEEHR